MLREATGEGVREVADTRSSTNVFHCPQEGQRPSHFGDSAPHSEQNHIVFVAFFAIVVSVALTQLAAAEFGERDGRRSGYVK